MGHLNKSQMDANTKLAEYAKKGRTRFDKEEEVRLLVIHYLQIIG